MEWTTSLPLFFVGMVRSEWHFLCGEVWETCSLENEGFSRGEVLRLCGPRAWVYYFMGRDSGMEKAIRYGAWAADRDCGVISLSGLFRDCNISWILLQDEIERYTWELVFPSRFFQGHCLKYLSYGVIFYVMLSAVHIELNIPWCFQFIIFSS